MATWQDQINAIKELRHLRNQGDALVHSTQIALIEADKELQKLRRKETTSSGTASGSVEAAEEKKRNLEQSFAAEKNRHKEAVNRLGAAINDLAPQHPRGSMRNLNDDFPFLLMPVRIETRFMTDQPEPELWIRIYPDDIMVHTHEKLLTKEEGAEGERYWIMIFEADHGDPNMKESRKKSAWSNLVKLFGPSRSAWVARQTKPTNWDTPLSNVNELVFPDQGPAKPDSWSRAPRTRVLPDRFIITFYVRETMIREIVGNIIPDELIMGPDPLDPDSFREVNGNLVPGESYDWTTNFEKAVELGLGIKFGLRPDLAQNGFDRIVVLGVMLSMDEMDAKQELETLIDNHHYSPNGFSLVKQGTPTNNTEQDGSGYTTNDPMNNTSYFVETGEPLFTEDKDCDGRNLANALGIDYESLQFIQNSNATDYKEAVAMNTVMYPSTVGFYFDTMMKLALGEETQDQLRKFFVSHVTGRGPLPAIRVGDQPYGILLTSDFDKWQLDRSDTEFNLPFLQGLNSVLRHYHFRWKELLNEVMFVGKPGADPSDVLMNILGLHAGSVSYHGRVGYPSELLKNKLAFMEGGRYFDELEGTLASEAALLNFLNGLGSDMKNANGTVISPPLLRLVFQNFHHTVAPPNIIDQAPLSETEIIGYYDVNNQKNYLHWLAETETVLALEQQNFGEGINAPSSLLYRQARRALLLQLHRATVKFIRSRNFTLEETTRPTNFYNIRPQGTVTRWELLKAKMKTVEPNHPQRNISIAEHILTAQIDEDEVLFLKQMRSSLQMLATVNTARLERCLTEHIDTCSYRLDAWKTALYHQRLRRQRQLNVNGTQQRRKGIYLGAFAIVENVRPASRRVAVTDPISTKLRPPDNQPIFEYKDNGGFVHAPSLNHAMAAALLRSGYLAHANSTRPDTMSVNLSSERIRRANQILQGIRNGQTLEALLGYQFERGLHDRASADSNLARLNEFIYNFRKEFPLELHFIQQQGTATTQTIPANNVVNGVKLAEFTGTFPGNMIPADATAVQVQAIRAERDKLNDSLDSIKDLFISESVYHLVQGNFDRAGAMVNALRDANIPPEIDVINTPRSSHFTFTNRVTIQFENLDINNADSNPWSPITMTPRALMEPGLNKWIATIIGQPDALVCRVSHIENGAAVSTILSLDRLEIQPIDLVYLLGNELNTGDKLQTDAEDQTGASEIESRIAFAYRRIQELDDETQVRIEFLEPQNTAGKNTLGSVFLLLKMLRSLVTDSRHLHAQDFDPPSKQSNADPNNTRGYDVNELQRRIERAVNEFTGHLNTLKGFPITVDGAVTTLQLFFQSLQTGGTNLKDIDFTLNNSEAVSIQQRLIQVSNFGLSDAFPKLLSISEKDEQLLLLDQAGNMIRRMDQTQAQANNILSQVINTSTLTIDNKIEKLIGAGKLILGDAFNILPLFRYNNPEDIRLSNEDRQQLLKHANENVSMDFAADEWMQNAAHVRSKLATWDNIRTLYETMHPASLESSTLGLKPVQLPYRANDSWVAVEFPEKDANNERFNILHDTLSVTIHGEAAFATDAKQAGLVVDDWTEMIPVNEETTGITFNFDQPNVSPAQALLLAVPPVKSGHWNWDTLREIVIDTLLSAKLRAIEPIILDKSDKPEVGVLLPGTLASYSTYDLDFALDYKTIIESYAAEMPIIALGTS